jgi:dihydroorotase
VFCTVSIRDNQPDFTRAQEHLAHYGDRALGIKLYFDTDSCRVWDISPVAKACEFARSNGCKVMVHCSNAPVPMMALVEALNPGDIITHAFHGGQNNASEDGFACLQKAKEKGVFLDAGFAGSIHVDFQVFADAVRSGILPDSLGTDLTRRSIYKRGGRYSQLQCMSMASAMGMTEEDIFRAVTSGAARVLGRPELGVLKPGAPADLAILDWTNQPFDLTDKSGNRLTATEGWRCHMTMAGGNIVYTD